MPTGSGQKRLKGNDVASSSALAVLPDDTIRLRGYHKFASSNIPPGQGLSVFIVGAPDKGFAPTSGWRPCSGNDDGSTGCGARIDVRTDSLQRWRRIVRGIAKRHEPESVSRILAVPTPVTRGIRSVGNQRDKHRGYGLSLLIILLRDTVLDISMIPLRKVVDRITKDTENISHLERSSSQLAFVKPCRQSSYRL